MPDPIPLHVRFSRPGEMPAADALPGRVAVLDLAFDGRAPQRSLMWARELGSRLVAWIDHHEQEIWEEVNDARFVLHPRAVAPACPPLVTGEVVARLGPADTLVCHGDLDGVLAAAKWMIHQFDWTCPDWLDANSIAADSRVGTLSPRGSRLDAALRGGGRGNRLRRAILRSVLAESNGHEEPGAVKREIDRAAAEHARVRQTTLELAARALPLEDLPEDAVLVDLFRHRGQVDLTELLLNLQQRHDWVIVIARARGGGRKIVVGTNPERSGLDLRHEFGVQGFAPFRVHAPEDELVERLPARLLLEALGRSAAS